MRRLVVALIALLLLPSCSSGHLPSSAIRTIPLGAAGTGPGTISDVLAASDDAGTVHVAWRNFDDASARNDTWYASTDGEHNSVPKLIPTDGWVTQLVAERDAVHLLTLKFQIDHQVARPPSGPWFDQGTIAPESEHVECLDAMMNGPEMIVAYLSSPNGIEAVDNPSKKLVVAELGSGGPPTYHELLTVPRMAMTCTGVRLAKWKGEIHLVCDVSTEGALRIVHSFRAADAAEWSEPEDVPTPGGGALKGIALTATGDRLFVFMGNEGLRACESTDGRHWSSVQSLGPIDLVSAGYRLGRNLDASASSDAVVVAWMEMVSTKAGTTKADVLAIASTAVPPTLDNLTKSPRIHVTPSARSLAGVVATTNGSTHQLVWASGSSATNDREVALARIEPRR